MTDISSKGSTNRKWASSRKSRENYDKIFTKRKSPVEFKVGQKEDRKIKVICPICESETEIISADGAELIFTDALKRCIFSTRCSSCEITFDRELPLLGGKS